MKRGFAIASSVLGFVAAGCFGAFAQAATTPPVKTTRAAHVPYISSGVRVAGVRVGGLGAGAAARAVDAAFAKPLPVVVDGTTYELQPTHVAKAYVPGAVGRAHSATEGDNVGLTVVVRGADVRAFVARIAAHVDRKGVPARLGLSGGQPSITGNIPGHALRQEAVVIAVVHALTVSTRLPVRFKTVSVPASTTRSDIGPVVLINRSLNRLTYFGDGLERRFPVATGQAIYPTPAGRFHIVVKWKDPWWYPPTYDSWAAGLKPVPPGPGNPLGTRWMGLSVPGVGIHGTDDPGSIGYSVSHGCIRMQVPDAEWLFDHVSIGTTVFIV
jgi:lipoprotein-anchoring transpeptidase ErfK/SrfK